MLGHEPRGDGIVEGRVRLSRDVRLLEATVLVEGGVGAIGGFAGDHDGISIWQDPGVRFHVGHRVIGKLLHEAPGGGALPGQSLVDFNRCGVPLVAVPITYEQPAIAKRIEWCGVGKTVRYRGLTASAIREAVEEVLLDGNFSDPDIPPGFAPFGIAISSDDKTLFVADPGAGTADGFDPGVLSGAQLGQLQLRHVGLELGDIDLFVYHQANARILAAVGERLSLDRGRVIDCIDRYGNTSSATLPIALADARERGLLEPGMNVLLAAFGAGFTWGAGVIQWGP